VGARGVGLRAGRRRRAMADTLVMRPRRRTAPTLRDLSGVRGDRLFERDWVRSASYFSRQAAKPQRPRLSRRDAQPSSASRRASETPQSSWRLCAFAREKQRRHDHPPLEEPIAATPGQVAQSRRAAERSPQARSSATPQTSLRLCASARDKRHAATTCGPARKTPIAATKLSGLCASARLLTDAATPRPPSRPPRRSAPPHPPPPTFFASPSCASRRISHAPDVRLSAPGALKPRSLSQHQKHEGAPVLPPPERPIGPRCKHRAQSPGLCAGPPSHNRPPALAEPPPEPPRPGLPA
jgi:hypothetical protein